MTSIKAFLLGAIMTGMAAAPLSAIAQDAATTEDMPAKKVERPYGKHKDGKQIFEKLDTNKDGALDLDEFLARHKEKFKSMDTDNNGQVSNEEFSAHGDKMRDAMKDRRGKHKTDQEQTKNAE